MNLTAKTIALTFTLTLLLSACSSGPVKSPQALYLDPDPAALAVHPYAEGRSQFLVELDQKIAKEPDNAHLIGVRAYQ